MFTELFIFEDIITYLPGIGNWYALFKYGQRRL